jgi:hypothetical protein
MIAAKESVIQGRPVKETTILFLDDPECVTLYLNELDLMTLQNVIGAYGFLED